MSCSVCAGHDTYNCPCCGEDVRMVTCPDCKGSGEAFYAFDMRLRRIIKVTELAYMIMPDDEDEAVAHNLRYCKADVPNICLTCKGEGEIPENY